MGKGFESVAFMLLFLGTYSTALSISGTRLQELEKEYALKSLVNIGTFRDKIYFGDNSTRTSWDQSVQNCTRASLEPISIDTDAEFTYLKLILDKNYWTSASGQTAFLWGTGLPVEQTIAGSYNLCVYYNSVNKLLFSAACMDGYFALCQLDTSPPTTTTTTTTTTLTPPPPTSEIPVTDSPVTGLRPVK